MSTEGKKKSKFGKIVKYWAIGLAVFMVIGMFTGGTDEPAAENPEPVKEADAGENVKKEEAPEEVPEELPENILKAAAKDANDLTGTYVDEEAQEQIIIIQTDAGVTYSYGIVDDTEPVIEQDCTVDNTGCWGKLYGISKNMDGSLGITSGIGGYWGNFVKISDEAMIDLSQAADLSWEPEETDIFVNDNVNPRLKELRSKADISRCTTDFYTEETEWNDSTQRIMEDDGNYFDEIVLGAWFDEYGNPKAERLPNGLQDVCLEYNLRHDIGVTDHISNFHFINSEDYTMDMLKRSEVQNGNYVDLYAFVLPNITKRDTDLIEGFEYTSSCVVVVHHNFSAILNGDNLLVIAKFTGLASDDTPNFEAVYVENLNNRF